MKIRSITVFADLGQPDDQTTLQHLASAVSQARQQLADLGLEVQSTRLASQAFSSLTTGLDPQQSLNLALRLDERAKSAGFDYLSLGPVAAAQFADLDKLFKVISETDLVFLAFQLFNDEFELDPRFLARCAEIILEVSQIESNGFANLKLAALANVAPGSPFFPAAYHAGGPAAFAFAPQAADLAVQALSKAKDISSASRQLTLSIEQEARKLERIGQQLAMDFELDFLGTDFSLAPFPSDQESLGLAIEKLGIPKVGLQGSLTASALLTSAIQNARYKATGFNGLFLPLLEDSVLARRGAEQVLTLNDLLLYSAVCGTGLDTLPLPGDASRESLTAILLDLAALAIRNNKPLTARLMPIPGKQAGELTDFDFEYFANSRILAIDEQGLHPPLVESPPFGIQPRRI